MKMKSFLIIAILLAPLLLFAQSNFITLDKAIDLAIKNNLGLRASAMQVDRSEKLEGTSFNLDKTQAFYLFDENNIAENGLPLKVWGVSQSIQFPTVYSTQKKMNKQQTLMQKQSYLLDEQFLKKEVSKAYYNVIYFQTVEANYTYLDSLFKHFSNAASRKFEVGETNYLEKLTANSKQIEVQLLLNQVEQDIINSYLELNKWLQDDSAFRIEENDIQRLDILTIDTTNHPGLLYFKEAIEYRESALSVEKQKLLPDLKFGYFQGSNSGANSQVYQGFEAGIGIPLFFGAQKSMITVNKIEKEIIQNQSENYKIQLGVKYSQLIAELSQYNRSIEAYEESGKNLASELLHTSSRTFQDGEIGFVEYLLAIENAVNIEMMYLKNLNSYNQTVLEINYLTN